MSSHPLQPPNGASAVLGEFLGHFGLDERSEPATLLRQLASAYAKLPYENLTKIIKEAAAGNAVEARRSPAEGRLRIDSTRPVFNATNHRTTDP